MKVQLVLKIKEDVVATDELNIEDDKLEPLSEDEVEAAIEMNIRQWAEQHIHISWEADQS